MNIDAIGTAQKELASNLNKTQLKECKLLRILLNKHACAIISASASMHGNDLDLLFLCLEA